VDKSRLRVYADTSVFGGRFDEEFERPTRLFFQMVTERKIHLVTSALVEEELTPAPERVRGFFGELRKYNEIVSFTPEAMELRKA
jgi:hypothetical protein